MSMTIQLLRTTDPANKIDKATVNICQTDPQCLLKEDCSILDPVLMLDLSAITFQTGYNLFSCNYVYIPEFSRFYHVTDIVAKSEKIFQVSCHVDVLKSYSTAIYNSPCVIAKNANNYNLYINDSNYKCQQNDIVLKRVFPSGFDTETDCFVMAIVGDKVAAT